jgi:predicted PurR-regulated permease PerM
MIITILVFFILTTVVGVIGILNLLNKVDAYEDFILDRQDAYEALLQRIRDIDYKEIFEKDDEVGVTFDDIKNEIEQFKNIIE